MANQNQQSIFGNEIASVGKHSMVYLLGQALSRAVGFFMIPVYTHFIAPSDYGILELVGLVSGGLLILISMSVSDSMSRFYYNEVDQFKRNLVVSTIIIGFAALGIPLVLFFLYFSQFVSRLVLESSKYENLFQIAFLTAWFGMLGDVGSSYLRVRYYSKMFVTVMISNLLLGLSLNIYFVVYLRYGILGILYSNLISSGITGAVVSIGILAAIKPKFSFQIFLKLIKFGFPIVPSNLGLFLGYMSNRFFLQRFATLSDLGLFSLGFNFGVVISRFINTPLNMFWGPKKLELLLNVRGESHKTLSRICTYNTFFSIFAALALSATIKNVIEIIADVRYLDAYKVVPIIAMAMVIGGFENHFNAGILISKRTGFLSYISVISLSVIILWNFLFIPRYGVWGAATANLVCNTIRIVLIYSASQRLYKIKYELARIGHLFIVAFILYLFCLFVNYGTISTLILRLAIVCLFPFILLLTNFYDEDELAQLRKIKPYLINIYRSRFGNSYS